jgi:hypothetical protein
MLRQLTNDTLLSNGYSTDKFSAYTTFVSACFCCKTLFSLVVVDENRLYTTTTNWLSCHFCFVLGVAFRLLSGCATISEAEFVTVTFESQEGVGTSLPPPRTKR